MSYPSRSLALLVVMLLALSLSACDKSGKEYMREAGSAIAQKKPDLAQKALDQALKKDPTLKSKGQRHQARIHMLRKDYDKAEQVLLAAWEAGGLGKSGLNTKQKGEKRLLTDMFTELYRVWAESMDSAKNPKKFEDVLVKGIKQDPNDPRLNTMLVDFYFKHAEKLIQDKKKAEAADMLDKVFKLRTTSKRRNESKSRAANLRIEVYNETVQARFDKDIKPELVKAKRFDDVKNQVIFLIEEEVDKRLRPGKEEDEKAALVLASKTLDTSIDEMVRKMHAFGPEIKLSKRPGKLEIQEKKLERGKYTLKATVPVAELVYYGRMIKKLNDNKGTKKPAAPKTPKKADNAPGDTKKTDAPKANAPKEKAAPKK